MKVEFVLKRLINMEYMKLNGFIDKGPVMEKKKPNPKTNTNFFFFFHLKAEKPKISPLLICFP